jgi:hypothetical protein
LPPAKEYHSSSAVLSAVVVPTAADIAYGITFTLDRLLVSPPSAGGSDCRLAAPQAKPCQTQPALSLMDLHGAQVMSFHKKLLQCFAEGNWTKADGQPSGCDTLTFEEVPSDR